MAFNNKQDFIEILQKFIDKKAVEVRNDLHEGDYANGFDEGMSYAFVSMIDLLAGNEIVSKKEFDILRRK